jgi:hypothetical protein
LAKKITYFLSGNLNEGQLGGWNFKFVRYLMMLSLSRLLNIGDRIVNEYGVVCGMRFVGVDGNVALKFILQTARQDPMARFL